jgi:hypothetical protein
MPSSLTPPLVPPPAILPSLGRALGRPSSSFAERTLKHRGWRTVQMDVLDMLVVQGTGEGVPNLIFCSAGDEYLDVCCALKVS